MRTLALSLALASALAGCAHVGAPLRAAAPAEIVGTREPFVSEAVYFLMTDRFVDGDPENNHRDQGGVNYTFDRPTPGLPAGLEDNLGYLGGDFKGIANNAQYLRDMGFTAVWLTPIVDNPDEAFTGGDPVAYNTSLRDGGKSGYHGYWGVNFYTLDEHLPSPGLGFKELTATLRDAGLKTVLDIVANHGSPAFSMPKAQPKFGQLYDRDGTLVADHQNLAPEDLDPEHNPLHRWYLPKRELVQLSNLDWQRPEVLDYFVGAYTQWLDQGADAFRIDTIAFVGNPFWKAFAERMRAHRPGLFMFAEHFSPDAELISQHTKPENGGVSVLDFPLQGAMARVFEQPDSDYAEIAKVLYLKDGPYANPYDLAVFYDNHDMKRLAASDQGFIDAHNLLFTVRGFPVVYYGSEIGFMRGTAEHGGNRNYYGQARVNMAPSHPIYAHLKRIADLRRETPALQRGVQVNLLFAGQRAAFLRVLQQGETAQTALVLLNKGDAPADYVLDRLIQPGAWRSAFSGTVTEVAADGQLRASVPGHGVEVLLLEGAVTWPALLAELGRR